MRSKKGWWQMRGGRGGSVVTLACVFALFSVETNGQSLTGSLVGTVKDSQAGVLPGAVVRVVSPALMSGEQQTVVDAQGHWRFPVLPPGEYAVSVEMGPAFATFRAVGLRIGAGETRELAVILTVAGIAESVKVEADVATTSRNSGFESRFGSDYIRTIPTRRFSMFDIIRTAPGVSPTSPTSGTVNTVSVFGSAVNENAFLIDGTNFTCPCQGVSRAEPIVDVIQEIHVLSMGASVEYGNVQGGVFNVVTKQGGPRLHAETSYYAQPAALTSQPITLPVTRGSRPSSGYERVRYRDFTTGLGGPLRRDRLWFFGAYQYLRDFDSQPGADPASPRAYEQNKVFGKLTWQITPSLQLMNSFHEERWVNPAPPTVATPFVATLRVNASVPSMTFANLTHVLSSNTVWEARVGRFLLYQNNDPSSGDRTTPSRRDQITGISSGNAAEIGALLLDRVTAKAVLHRYQGGAGRSAHHLKFGTQLERGEHRLRQILPGGVRYIDDNGAPFRAIFREPSSVGGVFITSALFASDSFSLGNRITVDAGLRFDHSRAISQDLPIVDAEGNETDRVTPGLGPLYTWNVFSPRIGVVLKLDAPGRTILRANYGRFYQGVLTGELDPIAPGAPTTTTMAYEQTTGTYSELISRVARLNLALDPETRAPRTDEIAVAIDRQIGRGIRASAAYIRKRGADFIGWTDRGGEYRESATTINATTLPLFELTNDPSLRRFVLTNPDKLFLHYDALVVASEKPLSDGWQASASYTYSRAYGLQVMSNATADAPQFSTIARPNFLTFGQDPNDFTNAAGRLPNDRPHIFRASGALQLPWSRIRVAANLQHFTGKPWAATAQVTLRQGSQRILLEPRGSRRLSSQSVLDVRMSKTFQLRTIGTIDVLLDVLNLLNDDAEEALQSDTFSSSTFGRPTQFIDPRRAMLGVRLNLGR